MTDPTKTAEALKPYAHIEGKPVLASWMGGPMVAAGQEILNRYNIPTFSYPDTAARVFNNMWRYAYNLRSIYETPLPTDSVGQGPDRELAREIIDGVRKTGRTILTEFESKRLLAAYGIPIVDTRIARSEDEAVKLAGEIGFPVVLKLYSETITHKTDVGGVQLNLRDGDAVKRAYNAIATSVKEKVGAEHFLGVTVQPMIKLEGYEIILGSSIDSQFGPVLLFGTGGQLVEVFKDRSLALPPLNTTLARRMMEQTKIYKALKGVRGRKSVDMAALEQLMVRFSQLIAEQRWIKELDINPLLASPENLLALDARVVLHDPATPEDKLPHLAIRSYPIKYVEEWTMKDGKDVTIRPIRPEDEPLLVKFHQTLSDRTVFARYFQALNLNQRIAHERLTRICFIDYAREMALVAEYKDANGESHILGVGRLNKIHGTAEGRFSIIVTDDYQHKGLGTELLRRLVDVAKQEHVEHVSADVLPSCDDMRRICEKVGFKASQANDAGVQKFEITL
jgi:acetyltransferase